MKEKTSQFLEKSNEAIEEASVLIQSGHEEAAASRAYYAMFYAAEALLWEGGHALHKHGAVHSAFGRIFVQSKRMDSKFHRYLLDSFDLRILSDYDVAQEISRDAAQEQARRAKEFLDAVRVCLER